MHGSLDAPECYVYIHISNMLFNKGSQCVSVDCLITSSAIGHIQSENLEFVGQRSGESV